MPLTQCNGNLSSFTCPTIADPIPLDSVPLPPPPGVPVSSSWLSLSSMMPQYAGRTNYEGTCGSHSSTQYYEYLVNQLGADLGGTRTVAVDGQSIAVPTPLLAYSVTAGLADLWNWGGTKAGDPNEDPTAAWPTPRTAPGMRTLPST